MTTGEYVKEFEAFHRLYYRKVCGYLRKSDFSAEIADEAVTFAFLAVRRHWSHLRKEAPGPYLFTVAERRALRLSQKQNREREALGRQSPLVVDIEDHRNRVDQLIDRLTLDKLLDILPPTLRTTVELRYREGLTVEETARRMDIAEGTVKSYTFRGLARLRVILEDEHNELERRGVSEDEHP